MPHRPAPTRPHAGRSTTVARAVEAGAARLVAAEGAPVLSPAVGLASLAAAPGVRVTLAASEPSVISPVAGAFDEDGRLWVVEMRTYMPDADATGETEARNRVVVLTDADGDGVFERSDVFLDGLSLPRGVAPCFGGALVIEPPSLYFCKDTDGDGRADVKKKLLDGFTGLENPEHAANGLLLGLDNWYHLSQHDTEFRFDGEKVETRRTPAHGQWGIAQDVYGRVYTTPNSDPLLIDLAPKHYAARNRSKGGVSFVGRSIVADKSVHPVHPTPGVNRGYQKNVLRDDQRLATVTAACGASFYDADALGEGSRGSAFVCEPAGNVVKRYVFGERDAIPAGRNAYENAEFLASSDERFRPVNTVVGPDGALYVLDMYRGVIQHKLFQTPYLRAQIDARRLASPTDLGRVYRVTGAAGAGASERPHLSSEPSEKLVPLLSHEDQWWRLAAQRLLVERRATEVAGLVRGVFGSEGSGELARLHALWTLEGIGSLGVAEVLEAMSDDSARVRAAGVRVSEGFLGNAEVLQRVAALVDDADRWVSVQAVCTLGELPREERMARLVGVLRAHGDDRWVRDAAATGLGGAELTAMQGLVSDEAWCTEKAGRAVLDELADMMLRAGDKERADLVEFAAGLASDDHAAAEGLVMRIRAAQRLGSDKPRPIALDRAPSRWIGAMGERFNTLGTDMGESEVYFDWPGRPEVRRVAGTRPLTTDELARFDRGRVVFMSSCVSCHQADGRGSSGLGPPLVASPIAEGPAERFASVLIHGLEGTWKIGEMTYEAAMPPAPVPEDDDLAAVMTYVRRSFGNAADPVRPDEVTAARAAHKGRGRPWTRAEVEAKTGPGVSN
jgi:mono/diheme cytochrome c family protein/glucose/arabinose dehydrogenase